MVDKRTPHVYVEFEAKLGELWATRTLRETWWTREQFTFMWNLRQNLEGSGHQEKYKSRTSVGRKFAPVEGLSHDFGLYRIDLSCSFCVAGVARSIVTPF